MSYYRQIDLDRMRYIASLIPKWATTILDIGSHDSTFAMMLQRKHYEALAADIEPSGKNMVKCGITHLPFKDNAFSTVTALEVLEHLTSAELKQAVSEIKRVAKHHVIVSVPDSEVPLGTGHLQFFNSRKLQGLFPYRYYAEYKYGERDRYCGTRYLLGRTSPKLLNCWNKIFGVKRCRKNTWLIAVMELADA